MWGLRFLLGVDHQLPARRAAVILCSVIDSSESRSRRAKILVVEPAGQLLGHGAGGRDELLAGDHLAHHEVAQELAQVLDDVARSEDPAEGILVAGIKGLLPALAVDLVEVLVGVAVQAVGEKLDHVPVVAVGARREAGPLGGKEPCEEVLNGGLRGATHGSSSSQTRVGLARSTL